MKKLFTILAVAAVMVSCAKEDVVSVNREAIGFDNAFIENSTRSVVDPSYTGTSLNDFAVFGFVNGATLFNGVEVSKSKYQTNNELSSDWKYEFTQYWINGATYDFYAVAPFSGDWTVKSGVTSAKTGTTLTFENENGTQDLLYAKNTTYTAGATNNAVAFTFKHILSKVKFSFENDYNATGFTIRVRDVKITNAFAKGDVVLTDAAAWESQTNATTEVSFGNVAETAANADFAYVAGDTYETYYERLLIPGQQTLKISFDVDLMIGEQVIKSYEHTATAPTLTLEPGKAYDFLTVLTEKNVDPSDSQEPIEFTATVEDWETDDNGDEVWNDSTATVDPKNN